jgi:hypothetical protein
MQLRDYQLDLSIKAGHILKELNLVCLFMEVRTGKTITALNTAKLNEAKKVLFITKKKAITSIQDDYNNFGYSNYFQITIINRESLHKLNTNDFDLVIVDECHGYGSFPKKSKYFKSVNEQYGKLPMILLSGTPTPESYSQYYHVLGLSNASPFAPYKSFYKWAKTFVNVKKVQLGYAVVNDYKEANLEMIKPIVTPYILTYTQEKAGFKTIIKEHTLEVEMLPITYKLCKQLTKDKFIQGKDNEIIADSAVKLQSKLHQLYSGTIKFEDGSSKVIDTSKAEFIKEHFKKEKIGIFYKFKAEYEALKQIYGDNLTNDLDEFNATDKNIALQILSGREGISLKKADSLVFYNIDFSATSYFQAKDRMTTMQRLENHIYWIFSKRGIEKNIYKSVQDKKNYTLNVFKKDYL